MIWTILLTQVALAEQPKADKKQKTTTAITYEYGHLDVFEQSLITNWRNQSSGFRVEKGLSSSMSVLASWNLSGMRTGFDNESRYYEDYGYYEEPDYYHSSQYMGDLDTLLIVNTIAGGLKYSYRVKRWLHPYATAQAQVSHGHLTLTDDIEVDKDRRTFNINSTGFGVGGTASLGFELRSKRLDGFGHITSYLEGGLTAATNLNFSYSADVKAAESIDIGAVAQSGQYFRWGVGVRF